MPEMLGLNTLAPLMPQIRRDQATFLYQESLKHDRRK
jgi:hypothetical protein